MRFKAFSTATSDVEVVEIFSVCAGGDVCVRNGGRP